MNVPDLFVGGVAITLGVIVMVGGGGNSSWWFELRKARWLESRLGRTGARVLFAFCGAMLILLGLAIASGFGPNKST